MRTRILIDDDLLQEALRVTGAATTGEVVDLALKTLMRLDGQVQTRQLKDKLFWEGDLHEMRTDA